MQQSNHEDESRSEFPHVNTPEMHILMKCLSICTACSKKCLEEGHKKTAALCADCADICSLTIKARSNWSDLQRPILELCIQACQRCADECVKMQTAYCLECASVCKQCVSMSKVKMF
jgi:hypothetical protein